MRKGLLCQAKELAIDLGSLVERVEILSTGLKRQKFVFCSKIINYGQGGRCTELDASW